MSSARSQPPPDGAIDPTLSGLQQFILEQEEQHARSKRPPPGGPMPEITRLALQVAHNLRFQHNWSDIRVHYDTTSTSTALSTSASSSSSSSSSATPASAGARAPSPPPRPMITGLPPQRLYVHPDEQIDLLKKQRGEGKAGMPEPSREREWVLPTHLREPWTLRRFADVFDRLSVVPPAEASGDVDSDALFRDRSTQVDGESSGDGGGRGRDRSRERAAAAAEENPWRTGQPKRLLLATLDDDSSVVYYIVHDGIIKPRQN